MPGLEKEFMFNEVKAKVEGVPYIFFARFNKLAVNDFSQFRRSIEKSAKNCFVAKKTMLKKVLPNIDIKKSSAVFEGSIVMITADKDPQIVSKRLVDFAKDKEGFKLAGAWIEGELMGSSYINELSKLPSKQELLAKVVGGIKSPITGYVLTMRGLLSSFLSVLDQVGKKK